MNDHIARMVADAEARLNDAEVLDRSMSRLSDAPALLRCLALEVLLKAMQARESGKYARTHDYACLWRRISDRRREEVMTQAEVIDPGLLARADLDTLLRDWELVFTKARYYFELYENYSLREQEELGALWVELGAPESEAEVRYHPREIQVLCQALIARLRDAA